MKILLASDWYAPTVNGVVTSVLNLQHGLVARGHEVRVLTLSGTTRSYQENSVTYIGSLSARAIYPGARFCITPNNRLLEELARWKPDVVHTHCEFSTFWMARRTAAQAQAPLVHTCHTLYENLVCLLFLNNFLCNPLIRQCMRYVALQTDCLIAPTEKVRKHLLDYGIASPLYVVPTGIAQDSASPQTIASDRAAIRKQWQIPDDHTLLIYLGRLSKEKHCEELLWGLRPFKGDPLSLLIVGDGPHRSELLNRARAMGLSEQVIFTGMVPPHTTNRYYHAADLFVSASTNETQGLTYLEALSNGLPMLCHADTALHGVLQNDINGWQYQTSTDFAGHLAHFLTRRDTSSLRENARKQSARYTIEGFAYAIESVYTHVLSAHAH